MATKQSKYTTESAKFEPETESKPIETKKELPKAPEPFLSFDAWFRTTGRKPHHKAGMEKYTNTKGRKPKAQWDQIFSDY